LFNYKQNELKMLLCLRVNCFFSSDNPFNILFRNKSKDLASFLWKNDVDYAIKLEFFWVWRVESVCYANWRKGQQS